MTVLIRPIRYTDRLDRMRDWAQRLGLGLLLDTPSWVVLGAGHGRLALHAVPKGDPHAGSTSLAVETDDLDALEAAWRAAGMSTRRVADHDVPLLFGTTPVGGEIAAGLLTPSTSAPAPREGGLGVMPMLVVDDVDAAADWLASWGLERRVVGERGGWADLTAPDGAGVVALHGRAGWGSAPPQAAPSEGVREITASLTFEHPDVDALLDRVHEAGLDDARVHDESYNRTLTLTSPDGDEVWVNGVMTDLYGYRRV
jgi:hypothetical protein